VEEEVRIADPDPVVVIKSLVIVQIEIIETIVEKPEA
jgi:hypothetical protein